MNNVEQQCKDVYSYYGLAMYHAQCLEQGMIQLIIFLEYFPKAVLGFSNKEKWTEDYNEFFSKQSSKTMGQLLGRLRQLGIPCEKLEHDLREAKELRNWLAHDYFSERATQFMNEEGRNIMVEELSKAREQLTAVENIVNKLFMEAASKYGLTNDMLDKIMEEMLEESNSDL